MTFRRMGASLRKTEITLVLTNMRRKETDQIPMAAL